VKKNQKNKMVVKLRKLYSTNNRSSINHHDVTESAKGPPERLAVSTYMLKHPWS